MLESLPITLLAGVLLGTLAGLGIGGGSLLILWLTVVLGVEQQAARSINLLFFLPCALIACCFRWKQGNLDLKKILPAVIAGCLCAGSFSLLSNHMDTTLLKKLFGALLIITGLRELFYRRRKAK